MNVYSGKKIAFLFNCFLMGILVLEEPEIDIVIPRVVTSLQETGSIIEVYAAI